MVARCDITEGVAVLTLADPARRNGLSPAMVEALVAELEGLRARDDVRCVILTGEGTCFSAGGDPRRMIQPGLYQDMTPRELKAFYAQGIQRLPLAIDALPVPTIAAVNGPAIGAGLDLAAICDMRIAAASATFASSFVRLGLVPGDGGAWILPRAVGMANAMAMILSGDAITAERAREIGLVSAVVADDDLLAEAGRLARRIADNPPLTVRLAKKLVRDCRGADLATALDLSASAQVLAQTTADHVEAVHAMLEKRAPVFTGR